jgi:predicted Rossmann fold flavoprotein
MKNNLQKFDVAVVGGGPAGMIAAGRAAELGARVVLIEKNKNLGKKLLITGKGRCNITNAEFKGMEFIEKLGKNRKFLFSSFSAFGPKEIIEFFEIRGLPTKTERGGRVFPVSDKAQDVLNKLLDYLKENGVRVAYNSRVRGVEMKRNKIQFIKIDSGKQTEKIYADKFILCTGGKSYPATGSTGEGYILVKKLGHKIIEPRPALTPIKTKEDWVKNLQGLSLKNVKVNIFQNSKKQDERFGEMLFTHFGLSGPIILDVSKKIGELLQKGEVRIEIDLKPALSFPELSKRIQKDFTENGKKDFKNYLNELLPQKMIETFIQLSGIEARKKIHFITQVERKRMLHLLKNLSVTAGRLADFDQAIITNGGVDIHEVDSKTMQSKIISNLFFAGEILDLDGPTGGFNLQICWSTGYAAGTYASNK